MKLKRDDKVIVILGKDKGKTGTVLAVLPTENKVLVENINVVKRHTKPSQKLPRGGILDVTKPIDASKVMVIDPASGKPARIGYQIKPDGSKERIFKVSANHEKSAKKAEAKPKTEKVEKKAETKTEAKPKTEAKKAPAKEGKK
jgi:large subunit ribosomal protein L24